MGQSIYNFTEISVVSFRIASHLHRYRKCVEDIKLRKSNPLRAQLSSIKRLETIASFSISFDVNRAYNFSFLYFISEKYDSVQNTCRYIIPTVYIHLSLSVQFVTFLAYLDL